MHKFYKIAAGRALRTHLPIHAGANVYLPRSFNQLFKYDLSEITGLDDLHNPSGFIKQAQAEAAELFLVEHSFFSVNGASACLMAACLALGEGGKVLVPVNAHKSIIAGLLLSGADPIWYEPDWDAEWGVYRDINPEKIADLLKRHKNENDYSKSTILDLPFEVIYEIFDHLDSLSLFNLSMTSKTLRQVCEKKVR